MDYVHHHHLILHPVDHHNSPTNCPSYLNRWSARAPTNSNSMEYVSACRDLLDLGWAPVRGLTAPMIVGLWVDSAPAMMDIEDKAINVEDNAHLTPLTMVLASVFV